jgi:hypothetical protein
MKLKSFSADDLGRLDKQVNEWLFENQVAAKSITVTPGQMNFPFTQQPAGKKIERTFPVFCAAIMYD